MNAYIRTLKDQQKIIQSPLDEGKKKGVQMTITWALNNALKAAIEVMEKQAGEPTV